MGRFKPAREEVGRRIKGGAASGLTDAVLVGEELAPNTGAIFEQLLCLLVLTLADRNAEAGELPLQRGRRIGECFADERARAQHEDRSAHRTTRNDWRLSSRPPALPSLPVPPPHPLSLSLRPSVAVLVV